MNEGMAGIERDGPLPDSGDERQEDLRPPDRPQLQVYGDHMHIGKQRAVGKHIRIRSRPRHPLCHSAPFRQNLVHTSPEVTPQMTGPEEPRSSLAAVKHRRRFSRQTCKVNQAKAATKEMISFYILAIHKSCGQRPCVVAGVRPLNVESELRMTVAVCRDSLPSNQGDWDVTCVER